MRYMSCGGRTHCHQLFIETPLSLGSVDRRYLANLCVIDSESVCLSTSTKK